MQTNLHVDFTIIIIKKKIHSYHRNAELFSCVRFHSVQYFRSNYSFTGVKNSNLKQFLDISKSIESMMFIPANLLASEL